MQLLEVSSLEDSQIILIAYSCPAKVTEICPSLIPYGPSTMNLSPCSVDEHAQIVGSMVGLMIPYHPRA